MSDGQEFILDCEYNPNGEDLLGQSDQEEEPMDQGDNCIILEGEEDLPPEPAEPPAELEAKILYLAFLCRLAIFYLNEIHFSLLWQGLPFLKPTQKPF